MVLIIRPLILDDYQQFNKLYELSEIEYQNILKNYKYTHILYNTITKVIFAAIFANLIRIDKQDILCYTSYYDNYKNYKLIKDNFVNIYPNKLFFKLLDTQDELIHYDKLENTINLYDSYILHDKNNIVSMYTIKKYTIDSYQIIEYIDITFNKYMEKIINTLYPIQLKQIQKNNINDINDTKYIDFVKNIFNDYNNVLIYITHNCLTNELISFATIFFIPQFNEINKYTNSIENLFFNKKYKTKNLYSFVMNFLNKKINIFSK